MKKPYIKKLKTENGIDFWQVDGFYIRGHIEEEFTNCADNHIFKFIPKNEVWIDKEYGKKEWKYYSKFFLAKKKYLSKGKSYKKAIVLGDKIEQIERNKSKTIQNIKKLSKKEIIKRIHIKQIKNYSNTNLKVWIVDGFLVRSLFFLDFTHGGHEYVYDFIPKNEIWIDNAISKKDIIYVLIHEANERKLMKKGMKYNEAHYNHASKIELYVRKNQKKANKILKKELNNHKKSSFILSLFPL